MSSVPTSNIQIGNGFVWDGPVPQLVQDAWVAWNNHTPKRIDYSDPFACIQIQSKILTQMMDEISVEPGNDVLRHVIMDIVNNPNKISNIERDMLVESGGPTSINTRIIKKYNIASDLCFGNMDIYATYHYTPNKVDLFTMEVEFSKSVLDERSWFDYYPGNEDFSKPRKENKVLLILLPEIFDKLHDDRTKTKTPEFKDFVDSELTRHYTNMQNYCIALHQRISGIEITPKNLQDQNRAKKSSESKDENVLIYFDAQRTRELTNAVIGILRDKSVRIIKSKDKLDTPWYHAYIRDNPECVIRVFYNIFENYHNSAVVSLYYQDEHITGTIPPGFEINGENNPLALKRLIHALDRRATMNRNTLLLGAANEKK